MKTDGVVVLYRPEFADAQNIIEYAPLLNKLFVMDNSPEQSGEVLEKIRSCPNTVIVNMGGNKGIAEALRRGVEMAVCDGADFCLTMDQDSAFPVSSMEEINTYLSAENVNNYGIIALNINNDLEGSGLIDVKMWMTSGNFINLKNYALINGFRSELFIDSVDFELNHQFYKINKKIGVIAHIHLSHKVGAPQKRKLFGIIGVTATNHSPIRCYYRFRNNYFLYREDKQFYRQIYRDDRKQKIKILFLEKDKIIKLKMIRLGINHAKQKKLGELPPEYIKN